MHGFILDDGPSVLAGSGGFSTDGERLVVSDPHDDPENVLSLRSENETLSRGE